MQIKVSDFLILIVSYQTDLIWKNIGTFWNNLHVHTFF